MDNFENESFQNNGFQNEIQEPKKTDGFAIASLVLGILSILCCCLWYVGLILGALGLAFGIISLRKGNPTGKGMAIAGVVCASIGLVLGIIMGILAIIAISNGSSVEQQNEMINKLKEALGQK